MDTRWKWAAAFGVALLAALSASGYLSWANSEWRGREAHVDLAHVLVVVTWFTTLVLGITTLRWRPTDAAGDTATNTQRIWSSIRIALIVAVVAIGLFVVLLGLAFSSL